MSRSRSHIGAPRAVGLHALGGVEARLVELGSAALGETSILFFDEDQRIVAVHGDPAAPLGWPEVGAVGSHVVDALPTALRETLAPLFEQTLRGATPVARLPGPDGTTMYETAFLPVRDADTTIGGTAVTRRIRPPGASAGARSYELAFHATRLCLALVTPNAVGPRVLTEVNGALADLFGYTPEEMVGMETTQLTHPADRARGAEAARVLAARELPVIDMERRLLRKDGSTFWGSVQASLLAEEGKPPHAVIAHVLTIDDRKRTEMALQKARDALLESQRHADVGSFEVTADRVLLLSEQLGRMLGVDPVAEPPRLEDVVERVHPEDRDRVRDLLRRPDRRGALELRYQRADGRDAWLEVVTAPAPTARGGADAMRGTIREITVQRDLQDALAVAERVRRAFEVSPVAQVVLDCDDGLRVAHTNAAAAQLLGCTQDELAGVPLHARFPGGTLPAQLALRLSADDGGSAGLLQLLRNDGSLVAAIVEVRRMPSAERGQGSLLLVLHTPGARRCTSPPDETPELTERELEVLQHVADGRAGGEIADVLHVSAETVKTHLRRIYSKLGVSDRAAAVATAMRTGLIS